MNAGKINPDKEILLLLKLTSEPITIIVAEPNSIVAPNIIGSQAGLTKFIRYPTITGDKVKGIIHSILKLDL